MRKFFNKRNYLIQKFTTNRKKWFTISRLFVILIAIIVMVGSLGTRILRDSGKDNLYAHQAQALLEGHLDIKKQSPEKLADIAVFNGQYYVAFPPFPTILLLPFVMIFGIENTKPVLIALILTLLNIYSLIQILKKIDTQYKYVLWLTTAFFLGTGYWSILRGSMGVWGFAQVVATTALFLALNEALGQGRGVIVGMFLGAAILSRQSSIFYLIFLCALLWKNHRMGYMKERALNIFWLLVVLGLWGGSYLYLNWLRFGNMFDTGYSYILTAPGFLEERIQRYGLFNAAYIPFNFIYMFIQGFQINIDPATLQVWGMNSFGTSLTFASPFLFIALWAKWDKVILRAAWISIILILGVILMYYNNGWIQLNTQRFALDFIPMLILLVALGMKRIDERIWKAAITYSVTLNILALFAVPLIVWLNRP